MIVLKFFFIILCIYFGFILFFRLFGPMISRFLLRYIQKKAQQDMDRQSRQYQQYAEGYSPYEESVHIADDVKVSFKREPKGKSMKDQTLSPNRIEQVDYEDLD